MGDHTETVQIDFDPREISYERIMELFWSSHNPCASAWSVQYKSAVWYHDDKQRVAAEAARARAAAQYGRPVQTEILPFAQTSFTLAEAYHQKYALRNDHELMLEFQLLCPQDTDFVNSTAAARVNAIVYGYVPRATFERELPNYGLSAAGQQRLRGYASRKK